MLRRMVLGMSLLLLALPAAAESKPAKPARPVPALRAKPSKPTQPGVAVAPRVTTGSAVEVLWGGQWWAAEVIESRAGISRIHYTGWGPEWDEWVGPERVRAAAPAAPAIPLKGARVGQRIEVEWHGRWWAAEVVAAKNGFYKIHYTGWGPEWDEWVELPRMRAAGSQPSRAPVKTPEIAGATTF